MRDVREDGSIRKEAVEVLDVSIQEVVQQLKVLEEVKDPEQEESYKSFYQEQ